MGFGNYVKKAIEVVKLNTSAMESLAKDNKAFGMGVVILALAGVAAGIGSFNLVSVFIAPFAVVLLSFIGVGVLHLLALLFGGKGSYTALYNVVSHASILQWVMVIPFLGGFLGFLAGLWRIVVTVVALETVHKLSRVQAIVVVLIPIIIVAILAFLLLSFFVGMMGGALWGSMFQMMR